MQDELSEAGITPEGVPPYDPEPEYALAVSHAVTQIPQTQDGVPMFVGMVVWSLETNLQYRVAEITQKPAGVVRVLAWPMEHSAIIGTRRALEYRRLYAFEHRMWEAIRDG